MFLFVSPFSVTVQVCNAEAIRQITMQRERFPKPCYVYGALNMFGPNVVTTEGAVWKAHRKATSASFNEKNAALVFREVIVQTNGMIDFCWTDKDGGDGNSGSGRIKDEPLANISADITRLTINVISYVGFGLRLLWPGQSLPPGSNAAASKYASLDTPEGYSLPFVDTLVQLLSSIMVLVVVPRWLLEILPLKKVRLAAAARRDYVRYLDEMLSEKTTAVKRAPQVREEGEGMDILGSLVQDSFDGSSDDARRNLAKSPVLSHDDILGNAFIMFVAGHETSANTIHFTLINLATNPAAQRMLQRDVDELVGDTDSSTWEYERLMGRMSTSAIGACMNETLRILPPGPVIPKQVTPHSDQMLNIDGRSCMLPRGSLIMMYALTAQKDPRHWPHRESKLRPGHDDLQEYRPGRWFETPGHRHGSRDTDAGTAGDGSDKDDKLARSRPGVCGSGGGDGDDGDDCGQGDAAFFRPRRGAYLPFSDGSRSCLGRRVAQVEIMTFLLVLLQRYSIELATDEWATADQVRKMDRRARAEVYGIAQAASRKTLGQAVSVITLGLQGKTVPMRLVPRGGETFVDWMA